MSSKPAAELANVRLDSWKEIAVFFDRDKRTVKRWEKERGLPVRRIPGGSRGSVFAYSDELTEWLKTSRESNDSEAISAGDAAAEGIISPLNATEAGAGNEIEAESIGSATEHVALTDSGRGKRYLRLSFAAVTAALVLFGGIVVVTAAAWHRAVAPKRITSIAVLPLRNATGDPHQDYLADGMTGELISSLESFQDLKVAPRNSAIAYKGGTKSPQQIMRALGVDALVSGEVKQSNGGFGLSAQIFIAGSAAPIWAHDYRGQLGNLLSIQTDVASTIGRGSAAVPVAPIAAAPEDAGAISPANERYLRAEYFLNRRDIPGLEKAERYFGEAITENPGFAPAYAGLAQCYALEPLYGMALDGERARVTAEKALQMDPNSAEAHTALGGVKAISFWDWTGAQHEFQQAIRLDPNYALAHHWYATLGLAPVGRLDEALIEMRRAHELDPLSDILQTDVGFILYLRNEPKAAEVAFEQALEIDPNFVPALHWQSWLDWQLGKYDDAYIEEVKVFRLSEISDRRMNEGMRKAEAAYQASGYPAFARAELDLDTKIARVPKQNYVAARLLCVLGNYDEALASLSAAVDQRDLALLYVGVEPSFKPLHSNPKFRDVLRRVGLPN